MKSAKTKPIVLLLLIYISLSLPAIAQSADEWSDQAYKEYTAKNYQKGVELTSKSIDLSSNPRAFIIRGDCRFSLKNYEDALNDYSMALVYYSPYYDTDKYKGRIYYWRARCKQEMEKCNDAITDFNNALSNNYEEAKYVYWNRANCYYDLGKYKESDDDYAKAIDRNSDTKDFAQLYKYRGDCNRRLGDRPNAEKYYSQSINYDPNNYNAYWSRGYNRSIDNKNDEAVADYTKAISIIEALGANANSNDLATLYRNIALIDYDTKKYDEALAAINKALLAYPGYIKAFQTRSEIYQKMKNYVKAKADYSNVISLSSDDKVIAGLYFDRSYKLDWVILDYRSALEDLDKSIALDPKDGMKFWHRALTYGYKKDFLKALADRNKASEIYGDKATASFYVFSALLKEKAGDLKGAIADYQSAIKLDNKDADTYYDLGRLFKTKMKNDDLAQINLDKAIELDRLDGGSSTTAYAKVFKGEAAEAIALIMERIEKNKDDAYRYKWELHNATCIYALAGNKAKALEYLDKSLAAGLDDYHHLVNDRDLVSLVLLPQYKAIMTKYKVPQPKW